MVLITIKSNIDLQIEISHFGDTKFCKVAFVAERTFMRKIHPPLVYKLNEVYYC